MKKFMIAWGLIIFLYNSLSAQYSDPNIAKPASGYGSDGTHPVGVIAYPNPNYPTKDIEIYYPTDATGSVPTIFYSHAYGGNISANISGILNFVATKGYAIVYVPYQTLGVTIDDRYNNLMSGFQKAARKYTNILDTTRVGFLGHSFGGGASFGISYQFFTAYNWGQNGRFICSLAPWYAYHLTQEQLQNFPEDTKVLVEIYNEDETNDHRMAVDLFNSINIEAAEKDFILVKSDTLNGYIHLADHALPNTSAAFDALDYYAYYRLLDALCDYTFHGSAGGKLVALGNGSTEQTHMPTGMKNLEETDLPRVHFPESMYEFPCSGNETATNPRNGYCPEIPEYTITAEAEPQNSGTLSGTGIFSYDTPVILKASPSPGYKFVNWTQGSTILATDTVLQFTADTDLALTAHFQLTTGVGVTTSEREVRIHPNPVTDVLQIALEPATESFTITLHDASGKLILKDENALQVEMGSLSTGVYFLTIATSSWIIHQKIIKK